MTVLRAFLERQCLGINVGLGNFPEEDNGSFQVVVSEDNVARMIVLSPIDSIKICFKTGGIKMVLRDLFITSFLPWKLLWHVFAHDVEVDV